MSSASLHNAARNGDLGAITAAIGANADLNARDQHSRTPLMLAAWAGHKNIVKALIAAGADVTLGASDNMNALHFAAQKGHTECARLLITAGCKVNSKNTRIGSNALIMASQHGHKELVALLLKRDANPMATTKQGKKARDVCPEECTEIREMLEAAEAEKNEAAAALIQKRKERNAERFAPTKKVVEPSAEIAIEPPFFAAVATIGPDLGPLAAAEESKQEIKMAAAHGGSDGEQQKRKKEEQQQKQAKKPRVELNYDEEDFET